MLRIINCRAIAILSILFSSALLHWIFFSPILIYAGMRAAPDKHNPTHTSQQTNKQCSKHEQTNKHTPSSQRSDRDRRTIATSAVKSLGRVTSFPPSAVPRPHPDIGCLYRRIWQQFMGGWRLKFWIDDDNTQGAQRPRPSPKKKKRWMFQADTRKRLEAASIFGRHCAKSTSYLSTMGLAFVFCGKGVRVAPLGLTHNIFI